MSLDNLKISTRLTAAFGLLLALLLAVAGAAMLQMGRMKASTEEITGNWLPSVERVNQMNAAASDFRVALTQHVLSADAQGLATIEKNLATAMSALDTGRQAYVKLIGNDEERKTYETFEADWKRYVGAQEQIVAASRKNEKDVAKGLLEGAARQAYLSANADLDKLIEINHNGAVSASEASAQAYAMARHTLIGAVLVAAVLAVGVALWLIRSITRPLAQAVEAADRVANGDLSMAIDVRSHDETGLLLAALKRMQQSLAQTVGLVRQNADSVATASAQIAQGNNDLSGRTEEQASALEQTAASMEELGSTVRQNADNARQANQLALNASTVATQGGEVVSQVVDTMKGINDSSKKIADIITVIDGIAFQTNILALNAAVEAARAGEQGRGFAVVAGEVRNLAQRAAAAAKEIKGLISTSVERVEQGTVLVDRAGSTMAEVVGAIRRVTDIMGEISAASTEQSAGVAQVGEAVTQMDQATQQNAALVEESAAAAESLRAQARQLVQAVAVFKLSHGQVVQAAAPVVSASVATWNGAERRGPDRATNVTRPAFKASATAAKAPPLLTVEVVAAAAPAAVAARTGTDDDWTSF